MSRSCVSWTLWCGESCWRAGPLRSSVFPCSCQSNCGVQTWNVTAPVIPGSAPSPRCAHAALLIPHPNIPTILFTGGYSDSRDWLGDVFGLGLRKPRPPTVEEASPKRPRAPATVSAAGPGTFAPRIESSILTFPSTAGCGGYFRFRESTASRRSRGCHPEASSPSTAWDGTSSCVITHA